MFKSLIYVFYAALLVISVNFVSATESLQLDQSAVKVDDRTTQTKNNALKQAFKNVLVKNSGSQNAFSVPSIAAATNKPTAFIRQYGYQEVDGQLYLNASFDHQKVIKLLRDEQLPVWGKQRPLTLFWLSQETEGERVVVSDESMIETRSHIGDLASERGVPVLLPIMDLDDSMLVSVTDIRGMFADQVAAASARYSTDYFIMVSIDTTADNQVTYSMALYPSVSSEPLFNPLVQRSGTALDANAVIDEIFDVMSEYFVSRYAVADSGESLVTQLTFTDITERKQLVAIEQYLAQLSAVKYVSLIQLRGVSAEFSVQLFGTKEDLYRLLKLESKIKQQPVSVPASQGKGDPLVSSQSETINYIWLGH
ncbi:DUF2066 domain-containing protein [Shewanella psychrotolerans]|uniref:DUF2066 domain-containing protein n=1 Tax=Shewanella psychrotolerans TaxID=2864206 RepID=UPI001C658076|nr:DUF2066 domain-containing protein [Shewanella psychrotolerans]QYJ99970.1 DUF2066 domain-containing protein [Shewanella psychrotolerans]